MLTGHNSLSTFPISLNQETEAKKASVLLDSGISLGKEPSRAITTKKLTFRIFES